MQHRLAQLARPGSRLSARRGQRGNALLLALLGLVVTGMMAAAQVEPNRIAQRSRAGDNEATILMNLASATNNAIFSNFTNILAGNAFTVNGVTITPALVGGELVWAPTVAELSAMQYLPAGWAANASALNEAPYAVAFQRTPAGCVPANCNIEGAVVLMGPLLADNAPGTTDGPVVGSILSRIGADSGVSLPGTPGQISGFGNTWSRPNPVAGTPPGVVAVRIGSATSGMAQFVRMGDTRDPNLQGNLTAAGNLTIGGNTRFNGAVTVNNQSVSVTDGAGTPCVVLQPNGTVQINCAGQLNARNGLFADGGGNSVTITPTGIVATGNVRAGDGFTAFGGNVQAFRAAEPDTIRVNAGDFFVRGPGGNLLRVGANGDVTAGRDMIATGRTVGQTLALTAAVVEGAACTPGSFGVLGSGEMAACIGGVYRPSTRTATKGAACTTTGATASDGATQEGLLCRAGQWLSHNELSGRFLLTETTIAVNGQVVNKPVCPGVAATQPLIVMVPQNEGPAYNIALNVLEGVNRYATDNGASWTVHIESSSGAPLTGNTIAHIYCYFPVL